MQYYSASLKIDNAMGNSMGQCITYFNIGNVYYDVGELTISLSKSYTLAKKLNSVNYLIKNTKLLSKIYSDNHNNK